MANALPSGTTVSGVHVPAAPAPDWVSQSTAIEQSRAVAQVQAAYIVAQQRPRNAVRARDEVREVCGLLPLAERAFFDMPRGDGRASGATIYLARELARIWGNVEYGLIELRRDDPGAYSEMQAFATDLQTNVRVSTSFTVPHRRDRKKGQDAEVLTQLRDIYENNANMGARRVRSQIYAILPKWLTDEAEQLCRATLRRGESGVTLVDRVKNMLGMFRALGVSEARIVHRVGKDVGAWTADDVADLGIVYRTIERRETTVDEAFPNAVTADEIRAQAAAPGKRPGDEQYAKAGVDVEDPPGWDAEATS